MNSSSAGPRRAAAISASVRPSTPGTRGHSATMTSVQATAPFGPFHSPSAARPPSRIRWRVAPSASRPRSMAMPPSCAHTGSKLARVVDPAV